MFRIFLNIACVRVSNRQTLIGSEREFFLVSRSDLFRLLRIQVTNHLLELTDVLEVPVNGCEADVGDSVQGSEALHDQFTDTRPRNLRSELAGQSVLNAVDQAIDIVLRYRTFGTCDENAPRQLGTVELFDPAVVLQDKERPLLNMLVGGESGSADRALPSPPHSPSAAAIARVDDPVLGRIAVWAAH